MLTDSGAVTFDALAERVGESGDRVELIIDGLVADKMITRRGSTFSIA